MWVTTAVAATTCHTTTEPAPDLQITHVPTIEQRELSCVGAYTEGGSLGEQGEAMRDAPLPVLPASVTMALPAQYVVRFATDQ